METADLLARLRLINKLTQLQVADKMNVSESQYKRYENGLAGVDYGKLNRFILSTYGLSVAQAEQAIMLLTSKAA